jgi:hypothetical protein
MSNGAKKKGSASRAKVPTQTRPGPTQPEIQESLEVRTLETRPEPPPGDFQRFRSRATGVEILARQATRPFVVRDGHVESRGVAGWWECRYVEADGRPSRNGWAMTPAGFDRLYEAVSS